jgi:Nucleotidyltransferase of unknown function (DUF6036)
MTREQLEHLIRIASELTSEYEIVVLGSQSILGGVPFPPESLKKSMEADLYPMSSPEKSEIIAGVIGEGSYFHDANGYYADGVDEKTSVLLSDWKERVVAIRLKNAVGYCLDVHDLAISKLVANREKDKEFVKELLKNNLLDVEKMRQFGVRISSEQGEYGRANHVSSSFERRVQEAQECSVKPMKLKTP